MTMHATRERPDVLARLSPRDKALGRALLDEGRLDASSLAALTDGGRGGLGSQLVAAGHLTRGELHRVFVRVRAGWLRSQPARRQRRRDQGWVRLCIAAGLIDREALDALPEPSTSDPAHLSERLIEHGLLDRAAFEALVLSQQAEHASCDICGLLLPLGIGWCGACGAPQGRVAEAGTTTMRAPEVAADGSIGGDPLLGRWLGGCRLLEQIGRGGMGTVYAARHEGLGRRVAVKILPHAMSTDRRHRERFLREARSAAQLSHPNLVPVIDIGSEDGVHFLVMEYVEGATLAELAPLPLADVLAIARQAVAGLHEVHEAGLIHRDIKPENLLVDGRGRLRVGDFGLARHHSQTQGLSMTGELLGTPGFMAPEQSRAAPVDRRADLFGLGATLHQLLTGRPPFMRGSLFETLIAANQEPLPRLAERGVPSAVERVLDRMTAKDCADRYANLPEALAALEDAVVAGGPSSASPATVPPPRRPGTSTRRRPVQASTPVSRRVIRRRPAWREPSVWLAGGLSLLLTLVLGWNVIGPGSRAGAPRPAVETPPVASSRSSGEGDLAGVPDPR